jgi:succinyl-CoA synthetase beta subunit
VASGIVATAEKYKTWGIVLGYPSSGTAQAFQNVVESVADMASCQVIVVRFAGVLHTERILVPIIRDRDLQTVSGVIAALSGVGRHRITILRLMDANVSEQELTMMERNMLSWAGREKLLPYIHCRVVTTSARLASIVQESLQHDLIVMAASETQGLQRFFFGSLAEGVAQVCERPMIMVYNPRT